MKTVLLSQNKETGQSFKYCGVEYFIKDFIPVNETAVHPSGLVIKMAKLTPEGITINVFETGDDVVNGFTIKELKSFPPDQNPFNHDLTNMGTYIGKNICVMFYEHENNAWINIIDIKTGRRIKVSGFKTD